MGEMDACFLVLHRGVTEEARVPKLACVVSFTTSHSALVDPAFVLGIVEFGDGVNVVKVIQRRAHKNYENSFV